jgi:hypothetical protein
MHTKLEGLAEIVKHFRNFVTCFSARVSWLTGVLTKAVAFEISQHEALGSQRMYVCCGAVLGLGQLRLSKDFSMKWIDRKSYLQMQSIDG